MSPTSAAMLASASGGGEIGINFSAYAQLSTAW